MLLFDTIEKLKNHVSTDHYKVYYVCETCNGVYHKNTIVAHRNYCNIKSKDLLEYQPDQTKIIEDQAQKIENQAKKIEELEKIIRDQKLSIENLTNINKKLEEKIVVLVNESNTKKGGIIEAHKMIYGNPICIQDKPKDFEDVIEKMTYKFRESSRNSVRRLWSDFFKYYVEYNATFEKPGTKESMVAAVKAYANNILKNRRNSHVTLNKYVERLKKILRAFYVDDTIDFQRFDEIEPSKSKYKFEPKELENLLEFLRMEFETLKNPQELLLFCSFMAFDGHRARETLNVKVKHFIKATNLITIFDTKNRRVSRYSLSDVHSTLIEEIINRNKSETIWGLDSNVIRKIRYYMEKFPDYVDIDSIKKKKLGFGVHCFRKTKLSEEFSNRWKQAIEATRKFSGHASVRGLEAYINTNNYVNVFKGALKCLTDFTLIGRMKIFIPWEARDESKLENFMISRSYAEYFLNKTGKKYVCPICYFIVDTDFKSCAGCFDRFHDKCTKKWENSYCVNCQYFILKQYKLREKLKEKYVVRCLFCNSKGKNICNTCFREKEGLYKKTPKIRHFKGAIFSNYQNEIKELTLSIALEKQNLKFYEKNVCWVCFGDCICDSSDNCLNNIILDRNPVFSAPIAIDHDEKAGFYVFATEEIKQNTFITEYVGDIIHQTKIKKTDSCMTLVEAGNMKNSVFIAPVYGGNFGKYVLGHPTYKNVFASTISVNGKAHVYLIAAEKIKKGDILYYYYGDNYPMSKFLKIERNKNITNNELIEKLKAVRKIGTNLEEMKSTNLEEKKNQTMDDYIN